MTIRLVSPDKYGRFKYNRSAPTQDPSELTEEFFTLVIHGQIVGVLIKQRGA